MVLEKLEALVMGYLADPNLPKFADQNYDEIKNECQEKGQLWEDPVFGPNDLSLWEGEPKKKKVVWKRPKDINPTARLFQDGHSEDDVQQGQIGNCWFVASVACFAMHNNGALIKKVIPEEEKQELFGEHYNGILLFRFYRFGTWVEVCIDDYLPTYKGKLLFMHSNDKSEFWPSLLEKAYAKLAGSYEALDSGSSADALVDLTGGVSQYYVFSKEGVREDVTKQTKLFKAMEKALSRSSLINCSMNVKDGEGTESKRDSGLVVGHAYTVLRCEELKLGILGLGGSHRLVKLRNPWGDTEWTGNWRDDDPQWKEVSDTKKKEMDFTNEDDGEFWMEFDEWLQHFDNTTICRLINTDFSLTRKRWHLTEIKGKWIVGQTAGGCPNYPDTYWTNPQIQFEILKEEDETVQICLCQRDLRIEDRPQFSAGFRIFKVPETNESKLTKKPKGKTAYRSKYTDTRELYARTELEVGRYVIIPSTFQPNLEEEFLLRIFTEDEANVRELQ